MRVFYRKVLDSVLVGNGVFQYLAPSVEDLLGCVEKLAFQLIVDGVSGTTPQIALYYIYANGVPDGGLVPFNNGPVIAATTVNPNQTNVLVGTLSGIGAPAGGMLGIARFYVQLTGTNAVARVKLHVCGRGKRHPEHEVPVWTATPVALEPTTGAPETTAPHSSRFPGAPDLALVLEETDEAPLPRAAPEPERASKLWDWDGDGIRWRGEL